MQKSKLIDPTESLSEEFLRRDVHFLNVVRDTKIGLLYGDSLIRADA